MGSDFVLSSMISNPAANTVSANRNKNLKKQLYKHLAKLERF